MAATCDILDTDGFEIIPNVLSESTVANVIHSTETIPSKPGLRNLTSAMPGIEAVIRQPSVQSLAKLILGPNAFLVRSILFDKTLGSNWKVAWHQDLTIAVRERKEVPGFTAWSTKENILHVQSPVELLARMVALRLHLDECGQDNGPLHVIPNSHRSGRLSAAQIQEWRQKNNAVVCTVPQGGALTMRPLLLHASSPAIVPRHRRVIHLEFAAESLPGALEWFSPQRLN